MTSDDDLSPSMTTLNRIDAAEQAAWADYFEALSEKSPGEASRHEWIEGGLLISLPSWRTQVGNRFFGLKRGGTTEIDSIVSRLKDYPQADGVRRAFQIRAADVPSGQALVKHGFTASDHSLARFVRVPAPLTEPETGLEVRQLNPSEAEQFALTIETVFGFPSGVRVGSADLLKRPGWKVFGALHGGNVVATGLMYGQSGCAWLGFDATMPDYRKRGIQRALIAARVNSAVQDGLDLLTVDTEYPRPGEHGSSFTNFRRAGFRIAYERLNFSA
jgi:GNAT superfamily N-acetyltransferase